MDKKIFVFFLLFSLVLVLGCTKNPGGGGDTPDTKTGVVSKDSLNATILINGEPGNTLNLISEQTSQVGINLRNGGISTLENVTGILLGCLDSDSDSVSEINTNGVQYMSWTVTAPTLGTSEVIRCPTTIRICFDYKTRGYTDLIFIPENYREQPQTPATTTASDFMTIGYNFGVIRVLNKTGINEIYGQMQINNKGEGWVDYLNYNNTNLSIYSIRQIKLKITGIDGVQISNYGGVGQAELYSKGWLTDNNQTFTINETDAGDYPYLLKMVQGKELVSRIMLKVTNPEAHQSNFEIGTFNVEIGHGYCIDIASINTEMRGR